MGKKLKRLNDGFQVTPCKIKSVQAISEEALNEMIRTYMDAYDVDGDGRISISEVRAKNRHDNTPPSLPESVTCIRSRTKSPRIISHRIKSPRTKFPIGPNPPRTKYPSVFFNMSHKWTICYCLVVCQERRNGTPFLLTSQKTRQY